MATLLYTIFGITAGASLHCAQRREISPCTCAPHETYANTIQVTCERMDNFTTVVDALQNRLPTNFNIWLKITHSNLWDLDNATFAEMNMNIKNLKLNHNNLTSLPVSTFIALGRTEFLSLSDNDFHEVPRDVFRHMPNIGTLDIARGRIKHINRDDFKALPNLGTLILATNQIESIDNGSFPNKIFNLHLGHNKIPSLNGTVRNMNDLRTLFINVNELTSLEDELPESSNLLMILANRNKIRHFPKSFKNLPALDTLFFDKNELVSLDGLLKHAKKLQRLYVSENKIDYLAEDEFLEARNIDELQMSHNLLVSLNNSLINIRNLRVANFSFNQLTTFSLKEIQGLRKLRNLDLSHNKIVLLKNTLENVVDNEIVSSSLLFELRLDHNLLKSLDKALVGLNNLRHLNLAHNRLTSLTADDFSKMEELETLDLSHNQLETLAGMSEAFLPSLETLNASFNQLTYMEKDFYGLPVLCTADLSNNIISHISINLVANTRCSNHGVPNKLKIYLQENPVLCADNLPELVGAMEMRFARLIGVAHCIVPQQIVDPSLHMQPPLTLQKMMKPQPLGVSPILQPMEPPPSIVQIIVPAALIQETAQTTNVTDEKPLESVSNDTETASLPEVHAHEEHPHEEIISKEENDTIHEAENTPDEENVSEEVEEKEISAPSLPKATIQDIPAEKSVDDAIIESEDSPEIDPIQEFNKIRTAPDGYPSLPEILHEVLPQPQRTHASLGGDDEGIVGEEMAELREESPSDIQKDAAATADHQETQAVHDNDDDLLQKELVDIADDTPPS
ncbi:insulin-like growth factor-binding protein complex acid labile subunit [Culicoides brevitarsis]|uniref:insulin-like growth factor-binding protein complex acid labile subunit n=1 Tax=Culicoides brevitarsis TaxID=469753 RepID=UPI00307B8E9A